MSRVTSTSLSALKTLTSLLKTMDSVHFRIMDITWRYSLPLSDVAFQLSQICFWETRMWIFRHRFNILDGDKATNRRDGAVRVFWSLFRLMLSVANTCVLYHTRVNSESGIPAAHCSPYVRASTSSMGARAVHVSTSERVASSSRPHNFKKWALSFSDLSVFFLRQTGSHASLQLVEKTFCPGLCAVPGLLCALRLRWNRRYWIISVHICRKRHWESNSVYVAMFLLFFVYH